MIPSSDLDSLKAGPAASLFLKMVMIARGRTLDLHASGRYWRGRYGTFQILMDR